jgi:K+-sensing histidine kinase KdpD
MTDTSRRVDTAVKQAVRQRNYRRVRDRALRRLANLYPDQYRELFEEERAKDEAQDKVWLDISGRTRSSVGLPATHTAGKTTNGLDYSQQQSNVGGQA